MDLVFTLTCSDRPGIVRAIANTVFEAGGNIIENQQFTDPITKTFVMRTRFNTDKDFNEVKNLFDKTVENFQGTFNLRNVENKKRALILVTKEAHCLQELIYLRALGELDIEIPVIASNREDLREIVEAQGIPFKYLPVAAGDHNAKAESETALRKIIAEENIELIVLARYMQIISKEFCESYAGQIINIHHSFLPGFKGAKPYHQAYERGVKIIGATAHFVTSDLDEGPIIVQDVEHVTHGNLPETLIATGRDIERRVLAKAVHYFAEGRIFIVGNRTVVFEH